MVDPTEYAAFLEMKRTVTPSTGITVATSELNEMLYPFQQHLVQWSLAKGRAALFADCGLGKTGMALDWAHQVVRHTSQPVLIVAPLAVSQQTVREGEKFGIPVHACRRQSDMQAEINITNYEMLEHFLPDQLGGLVLDESSILKGWDGTYRQMLTAFAAEFPFRLACTATPAPNDLIELVNHAEFLGIMRGKEMIALFFTQDGNTTNKWKLKGHARDHFWQWLATWSVAVRRPSDLGYDDDGFILPPLTIHQTTVAAPAPPGYLLPIEAQTLSERLAARRSSIDERVAACADLANNSDEAWMIWCNLNAESEALVRAIPDAVEVRGSDSPEHKERALLGFCRGEIRVLVSKASIAGFGLNMQICHNTAFVGLSDSWEAWYQAIRRCWRFGQLHPVHAHVIVAETEGAVVANIQRKEKQAGELMDGLAKQLSTLHLQATGKDEMEYIETVERGVHWTLHQGDCVDGMDALATDSVGLTVSSPPFPGMYAYTNSMRDMGNTRDMDEMLAQFRFLVGSNKLLRVTMPGRMACFHLMQSPIFKNQAGYTGMADFRGKVIALMQEEGWIYYGEVTIDKNAQLKAQRTKERGLLFKTLATDSSHMRMAMADYLLYFRKPGDNPQPIRAGLSEKYDNPDGWITQDEWIEWAAPVWLGAYRHPGGIRETDVLPAQMARDADDEKHLAPLQLGVIERAVKLWSAPGDLVCDPFAGIGSTGFRTVELGRRFVGFELKPSYFQLACRNLHEAERRVEQPDLFASLGCEAVS